MEDKKWIQVSAKTGRDVNNLKELIKKIIEDKNLRKLNNNYSQEITKTW